MVDLGSLGASVLVSATARFFGQKTRRMLFLEESVESAATRVAERHEGLHSDVFAAVFDKNRVRELVEDFDSGGPLITPEQIAESFDDDMLDEEIEASPEELVTEFLTVLNQEISQDPEIGNKLLMNYTQRNFEYTKQIQETQEEELFELRQIKARVQQSKGYTVFEEIGDRFRPHFNGEHPTARYDLPFYGRQEEVKAFFDFIDSEKQALLVSGPAGIGKTRLVVEASLQFQTGHPDWQVYAVDHQAGNIDEGLSEIDWESEENIVFFLDDARQADQIGRIFDLASRHRSQVKLVFTERPSFVAPLQDQARNESIRSERRELSPLDSESVAAILEEYYGITDPGIQEWILQISEGRPLLAHLLADQIQEQEDFSKNPIAKSEDIIDLVFEDIRSDITDAAKKHDIGDPQQLKRYFEHLAAVGHLNTANEEMIEDFRKLLSINKQEESTCRRVLSDSIGLIDHRSNQLRIQPDALREHIVYSVFFQDSTYNYYDDIYSVFEQYTAKEQISTLAIIEARYESREAGNTLREIMDKEIDQVEEMEVADQIELLRRFDSLGHLKPIESLYLVDAVLNDLPEEQEEEETVENYHVKMLRREAVSLLAMTLQSQPQEAAEMLFSLLHAHLEEERLQKKILHKLRDELRPQRRRPPARQKTIIEALRPHIQDSELSVEIRCELLDIIGETSGAQTFDSAVDPVNQGLARMYQNAVPQTDQRKDLRATAITLLIDVIESNNELPLRAKASEVLARFQRSHTDYYRIAGEVYDREELKRIYRFVTGFVSEAELRCVRKLDQLAELEDQFGVDQEVTKFEEVLKENEQYRLMEQMQLGSRRLEEREEEIAEFVQTLDTDKIDATVKQFVRVVEALPEESFSTFFRILGRGRPDMAVQILEQHDQSLDGYQSDLLCGICMAQPNTGERLVSRYLAAEQYELACPALSVLLVERREFTEDIVEQVLSGNESYPESLVAGLGQILNGQWKSHPRWTEEIIKWLFQDAESLSPGTVRELLISLPLHREEAQEISDEVLFSVLDWAESQPELGISDIGYALAEAATRHPLEFTEFCISRLENSFTGTSLLPSHLDIDRDRIRHNEEYSDAVERVGDLILDEESPAPLAFKSLIDCIYTEDLVEYLVPQLSECSTDQLLRVIQFVRRRSLSDPIKQLLRSLVVDGIEDFSEAEDIQNHLILALKADSGERMRSAPDDKQEELRMLREWQEDKNLPLSVQKFANRAEQSLYDSIEREEEFFRG